MLNNKTNNEGCESIYWLLGIIWSHTHFCYLTYLDNLVGLKWSGCNNQYYVFWDELTSHMNRETCFYMLWHKLCITSCCIVNLRYRLKRWCLVRMWICFQCTYDSTVVTTIRWNFMNCIISVCCFTDCIVICNVHGVTKQTSPHKLEFYGSDLTFS